VLIQPVKQPRGEQDVDNMVKAIEEQVTKEGLFKSSEVSRWRARFAEWTSATPDRKVMSSIFEEMIRASESCDLKFHACKRQNSTYYFRFDNEVRHLDFSPGTRSYHLPI
jgi:hypothetical protein